MRVGPGALAAGADGYPSRSGGAIPALAATGLARNSLRHSLGALRGVLDHAGVEPNPARDRGVRLPHEPGEEIDPPTAAHVERALSAVAPRYRLPLIVL